VPYFDNPAGRLHDLLSKLAEQPGEGSLLSAWSTVLEVDADEVVVRLGQVADLVRETQIVVEGSGEAALVPLVSRFRGSWARPIFPQDRAFNDRLEHVIPEQNSLDTLGIVSAHLHAITPEGVVPSGTELERLKGELRGLIDEITMATDIPDEVKHLLVSRLRGVEEAIEHIHVGGPGAVQRAMEVALGSVFTTPEAGRAAAKSPTVRKMFTTLWVVWAIFSAGPVVHDSIDGWGDTIQMLSPAPEHSSQEPKAASGESDAGNGSAHANPR
jgi:hypothetical protein